MLQIRFKPRRSKDQCEALQKLDSSSIVAYKMLFAKRLFWLEKTLLMKFSTSYRDVFGLKKGKPGDSLKVKGELDKETKFQSSPQNQNPPPLNCPRSHVPT